MIYALLIVLGAVGMFASIKLGVGEGWELTERHITMRDSGRLGVVLIALAWFFTSLLVFIFGATSLLCEVF